MYLKFSAHPGFIHNKAQVATATLWISVARMKTYAAKIHKSQDTTTEKYRKGNQKNNGYSDLTFKNRASYI
jgi:hypothetical protein